jgi:hypothetical protein
LPALARQLAVVGLKNHEQQQRVAGAKSSTVIRNRGALADNCFDSMVRPEVRFRDPKTLTRPGALPGFGPARDIRSPKDLAIEKSLGRGSVDRGPFND